MAEPIYGLAASLNRLDPVLYTRLQDEESLEAYLGEWDGAAAESTYDYLETVLEQDFRDYWLRCHESGIIRYELINLCAACEGSFAEMGWPEGDDSRLLRYAIITAIADYLEEGGSDGL